jgi:hypothetical protein
VPWVESQSLSFSARHDSSQSDQANRVLDALEHFRDDVRGLFERTPGEVAVVLHPRSAALTFAHPWLPLARLVSAPAGRRYFAGWFSESEIHVLAPSALERRASAVPGSREALLLAPQHEYAHIVIGANNPDLPPPFSIASFRRYVSWAWLCEGAASWLAGQTAHLRAAIVPETRCSSAARSSPCSSASRARPRPRCWPRARSNAARARSSRRRSAARPRASSATGAPSSTRSAPEGASPASLRPHLRFQRPSVLAMMFFWISEVPP